MRLFFAADPDVALRRRLAALATELGGGLRPVPPAQLHLTLHFIEDAPARRFERLMHCAEWVIERQLPFAVPLSGPVLFPSTARPQVVAALASAPSMLGALAEALRHATRRAGLPVPRRRFRGHITLARLYRGAVVPLSPPRALPPLDCRAITLYQSELRPEGARHTALMQWPLGTVSPSPRSPSYGSRYHEGRRSHGP